ncbi:MAG: glyoxalase [Gammaproteobacteria bacterium]|nr:MAG: glyoxalase [Gammaproteobacteria bacterium]
MKNITGIHHVSLVVADTTQSLAFYCGVLGLETLDRPDLGYPGAWLAVGDKQIHLLELPNPDAVHGRPIHGGRDRHTAITVRRLDIISTALEQADIHYTLSKSGRRALFCRDPDGNALEMIEISD